MKRLNLLIAALGLAAGAANAQPPGPPPGGRFDLDDLAILLDLDAYQKGEVGRVLDEQREAIRAAFEAQRAAREQSGGAPTDERPPRGQLDGRPDELFGKLQNILTEQQITKLKILMQPPRGGRGPRGAPF
ncbi:MAG TPA: hypothetical protein VGL98_15405 [Gammaproteobacteria bacterium]